jgi:hypothetical protein
MSHEVQHTYFLIRDGNVLVRVLARPGGSVCESDAEFFDVRTGVQLKAIHPPLNSEELERAHQLTEAHGAAIIKSGTTMLVSPLFDSSKIVSILDIKQRRLDSVVADSVLDQLRAVCGVLQRFLDIAEKAQDEERFWLSQQVLTLLGKFSGRELAELEEIADWFTTRPKKG